jgi:DNA-binding NarL/FixJ family response regulator
MLWVTLMVSRSKNLFPYYKQRLEELGYRNVIITDVGSDGLYMMIREIMPRIIFIDSAFKKGDTPFWITNLHKQFKKLNIAVISLADYPDDLAMYCIVNGAKSYVNQMDGMAEFDRGMKGILRGEEYISPGVRERQRKRIGMSISPTGHITGGQLRIIKTAANGWTNEEIAKTLEISETTVEVRKSEIYTAMNVRNGVELAIKAMRMGITSLDEIVFFGGDYELKPLPPKKVKAS